MSQPIEATIRISADAAGAAKTVKALQSDLEGLKKAGTQELEKAATGTGNAAAKAQGDIRKTADESTRALRQTSQQIRAINQQLPDILGGLATGQNPFTVLIQQGGQVVQQTGSVSGAFRALTGVFSTARVVIGATATALATVAFQAVQGAIESDNLRKSLALTGNQAGRTAGDLNELAKRVADSQKASIGSVRETIQAVIDAGRFVGPTVESAVRATEALRKLSGASAADTVKQFASLTDGVAAGAIKLNQAYNFLTARQVDYVRGLESQGKTQEAVRFTLDELAKVMQERSVPSIYAVVRAWVGVKNVVSEVGDRLKQLLRDETSEDRIAAFEARLKRLQTLNTRLGSTPLRDAEIADVQSKLATERSARDSAAQRAAAQAAAAQEEQQKILRGSKSFQDLLAGVEQAGAQKSLAIVLAGLSARQSAVERANAQGVMSAEQYAASLTSIEIQRLKAQENFVRQQLKIEQQRTGEGAGFAETRAARVAALEAQLVEVAARVKAAEQKALSDADGRALERARTDASEWTQIWQRAAGQISQFAQETAATQARLLTDASERAATEAQAATAAIRRDVADLQRDLELQISLTADPDQKAELERALAKLGTEAGQAIGERLRSETFASLGRIAAEIRATLSAREGGIQARQSTGEISQVDAERELAALRKDEVPQLERVVALMKEKAKTAQEKAEVEVLEQEIRLKQASLSLDAQMLSQNAIGGLSTALTDIVTGAKTGKEALLDMVGGFAKAMLDVLNRRLAEQLVKQFASAIGPSSGGGTGGNFFSSVFASLFHEGGTVGQGSPRQRAVNPAMFTLAPRFHNGLLPDEYPAILQRGETVRTEKQERALQKRVGGVSITNHMTITGAQADPVATATFAAEIQAAQEAAVEGVLVKHLRPGGLLDGLRPGRGG